MRAAAPLASSLIIYLLRLFSSVVFFKRAKKYFVESRYVLVTVAIFVGFAVSIFGYLQYHPKVYAHYVSTTEGDIYSIDPFKEEWAQIGWYQWWPFNDNISDFVFKAHFNWSTASDTPDESGCGFVFGIQENGDHYSVFLDKSRILFMMKRGTYAYMVGKTRGPGRTNFGNPAEADFVLSVKGQSAFVSVDGEVTEYTLSADQTSAGDYGLTLLSGTNSGYGTRCEMNDILMWTAK